MSWITALARVPDGVSCFLKPCWASSVQLPSRKNDAGFKAHSLSLVHLLRPAPFQRIQTHAATGLVRTQPFHTSAVWLKKRQKPEPPPRELDLLRYDMKDIWKSPKPAMYLGLAGLIPFITAPLLMALTETFLPQVAYAQLAYGASIISFLGGARWGFALPESSPAKPDWINLANSVVPPLLAWTAMLLSDSITPAVITVIMGLGISLHYDLSLLPTYPSWFKALRSILTIVASVSLISTLLLSGIYPEKTIF